MLLRRVVNGLVMVCAFAWLSVAAMASEYHGQVTFSGLPLPGSTVTVTATQGDKKVVAISDEQGLFSFADLADGKWTLTIAMTGFAPLHQEMTVGANATPGTFEMKLMTLAEIRAQDKPVKFDPAQLANPQLAVAVAAPSAATTAAAKKTTDAKGNVPAAPEAAPPPDATAQQANDGYLINGSVNNASTSQYSLNAAFGNNRNTHSLYSGNAFVTLENSSLDAAPYNLTGVVQPRPDFNNYTAGINYGGPLNIKHLMPRGPNLQFNYSHTQDNSFSSSAILIPNPAQKDAAGDWNLTSPTVTSIVVPSNLATVAPACNSYLLSHPSAMQNNSGVQVFANNTIPAQCVTSASNVLLSLYPQNTTPTTNPQYNYEVPLNNSSRTDNVGLSAQKQIGNKNSVYGRWNFQDSSSNTPSVFGFLDTSSSLGTNATLNFSRRFTARLYGTVNYSFGRQRTQTIPFFANKNNIQATAGITGASIAPNYWGPPSLSFSSGIYGLSDGVSAYNRQENNNLIVSMNWNHMRHNVSFGGGYARQEANYLTELNPDGSLSFTGQATRPTGATTGGSDFADFLLGIPDTSKIAYGNADKYLRQTTSFAYVTDDFRVNPELSVSAGLRWEYGSPVTETKGRLVNLSVAPGFGLATPVVGSNPLLLPDYSRPEPHIGIAWRPISGSSLLIRSGYDVTNDTSVYRSSAYAMAQQQGPPSDLLSTSLSISNGTNCPFNIFSPFALQSCNNLISPDQFAIDPHFRVAYVQTWNLSVQRDLPMSLQMIATYLGTKGTRGVQEFVPNTCAPGTTGATSCPQYTGTSGYIYRTSNGNLTRQAGSLELRRRLRNGLTARALYTYAKSLDDDYSLSGQGSVTNASALAQDWTNPAAQRGLSTTDQRHQLTMTAQYTTGMGLGGKMLLTGWRGAIYKEWTVNASLSVGSGLPETPIYLGVTALGTGVGGSIRPNVVASPYAGVKAPYVLNANSYAAPAAGAFGNARRDSIEGPDQFTLNAGMNRTFRLHDKYTLDAQLNATNVLNHPVYSGWNTYWTPNSTTFGEPLSPGSMRSVSLTLRARF